MRAAQPRNGVTTASEIAHALVATRPGDRVKTSAPEAAARDLRHKRQQVLSILLRHKRIFTGHRHGSRARLSWLAGQTFSHRTPRLDWSD